MDWWRLGEANSNEYKAMKMQSVVPMMKDRLLISQIKCKDVLGCSLDKSATFLAYTSVKQTLGVIHLSKPKVSLSCFLEILNEVFKY